jgi:hypothetical protein
LEKTESTVLKKGGERKENQMRKVPSGQSEWIRSTPAKNLELVGVLAI